MGPYSQETSRKRTRRPLVERALQRSDRSSRPLHCPIHSISPWPHRAGSNFPGSVEHSKPWCEPEEYRGKRVVVVGASISGTDISFALADVAKTPLHSPVRGRCHPYFFDWAFRYPNILCQPPITHIVSSREINERAVHFQDGMKLENVDHVIFSAGYS